MSRFLSLGLLLVTTSTMNTQEAAFELGPDSHRQPGVPRGEIIPLRWETSEVYPNTERDWWIYVPAQYDGETPTALMVFQDCAMYLDEEGSVRVSVVFDNLIQSGEMPVTIGVFINLGRFTNDGPNSPARNRSTEYDTLSDQYARFLLDETIPGVRKTYQITDDPDGWAIGCISSGGICAFTVAWERPDKFRKVVSHVGSFTNIRGGHVYPDLIRRSAPKPIRVFLQDGTHDLNLRFGNWWLANQQMADSFAFAGYDVKTAWGEGGHNLEHGGALFPDTMRWLWRDYRPGSVAPLRALNSAAESAPVRRTRGPDRRSGSSTRASYSAESPHRPDDA
ncbi:MAG: alpha/beta hydrolase-fold protein [Acidobacteriota bacterium]|nr:alpha/beta hydrolase-fold protein [Acidobacteriota bacterium]